MKTEVDRLSVALAEAQAVCARLEAAAQRLVALQAEEAAARRRRREVSTRHEMHDAGDADLAAAETGADRAEAARARQEDLVAGLRDAVEERAAALPVLITVAERAIEDAAEARLANLNALFGRHVAGAAKAAAEAFAVADAAGLDHRLGLLLRLRLPRSLLRSDTLPARVALDGDDATPPLASDESRRLAAARSAVAQARSLAAVSATAMETA
jgi:hypothetical protein